MDSTPSPQATRPSRFTYIRFLEALLGSLPETEYRADVGSWAKAIYDLRELYEAECPELFEDIVFLERHPLPPHSDQVAGFLMIEQQADVTNVYNPGFERLQIREERKELLRRRSKAVMDAYGAKIEEMVQAILPRVSLPKD